ncbi:TetR/AcrR family transcriptional regulator [Williamsia sp. M5A3_1d]
MSQKTTRNSRAEATRDAILAAAERLFAEDGINTVSNRQVSEAAGQGNNAAVGYHFGTKADLVSAIIARHAPSIDRGRADLVRAHRGSGDIRAWVSCLVLPVTDHLATLGGESWYARFCAQVSTDPELRPLLVNEATVSQSLRIAVNQLAECTPDLDDNIRNVRNSMARLLVTHGCAEFERYLAREDADPSTSWERCGHDLVDAIVGIWAAPVTP